MDQTIIERWNRKVQEDDHVYIVGDVAFQNICPVEDYLKQLKGQKHPILGSHEQIANSETAKGFSKPLIRWEVQDVDRRVCLYHYPLAEWNGASKGVWHIYGHIHAVKNDAYPFKKAAESIKRRGLHQPL